MFHKKFDPETTYVVSDIHVQHTNIVRGVSKWKDKSHCRNFNSVADMDAAILKSLVLPQDSTLFLLGDLLFGDKNQITNLVRHIRQTCKYVNLIFGNHDDFIVRNHQNLFDWCGHYTEIVCDKRLICLSHFPILQWRDIDRGSYHLFGHVHGTLNGTDYTKLRCLDVGWDVWNKPISLIQVDKLLKDRPYGKHI